MMDLVKAASYIVKRYQDEMHASIDEMKLHKLLYFSQREAIIQINEPMFDAQFEAWKYGPVMVQIRDRYRTGTLNVFPTTDEIAPYVNVFNNVFSTYAGKDSWSLSILTHGEKSWQIARKGIPQDEQCSVLIKTEDIAQDALRIKMRRYYFEEILPSINEN